MLNVYTKYKALHFIMLFLRGPFGFRLCWSFFPAPFSRVTFDLLQSLQVFGLGFVADITLFVNITSHMPITANDGLA